MEPITTAIAMSGVLANHFIFQKKLQKEILSELPPSVAPRPQLAHRPSRQELKLAFLPQEHYDLLADRVLGRHAFFARDAFSPSVWDDVVEHAYNMMQHPAPELYVSSVKNRLRNAYRSDVVITHEKLTYERKEFELVAFKLYVLLRHRFGQDDNYRQHVLTSLYELIDRMNTTPLFQKGERLHVLFQNVPPYSPPADPAPAQQTAEAQQIVEQTAGQPAGQPAEAPGQAETPTLTARPLRVSGKHKTDFIKVFYAMAGLKWVERADGVQATIEDVMAYFGDCLGDKGIKDYSPFLSKALDGTEKTFLQTFEKLEIFMRTAFRQHNK